MIHDERFIMLMEVSMTADIQCVVKRRHRFTLTLGGQLLVFSHHTASPEPGGRHHEKLFPFEVDDIDLMLIVFP